MRVGWHRLSRWWPQIIIVFVFYLVLLYMHTPKQPDEGVEISHQRIRSNNNNLQGFYDYTSRDGEKLDGLLGRLYKDKDGATKTPTRAPGPQKEQFKYTFVSKRYGSFTAVDILTASGKTFEERMTCNAKTDGKKKVILSWEAGHTVEHLNGCPDWNCEFTNDKTRADEADVVFMTTASFQRRNSDQYIVFFSQESPKNAWTSVSQSDYYNFSLGFRHDTAGASPYGYVVKLAEESQPTGELVDIDRIKNKTKPIAWFVSHCQTNSRREDFVKELKNHIDVDVYGACEQLQCPRSGECEKMLDTHYYFYLAFENSICTDYITEKVWNNAYAHDVIPIVLKRSIVEGRLPPNSFLAVDDFETIQDMVAKLEELMINRKAYSEYFNWRREYKIVYLDGSNHDALERPWGFCQMCRLAWTEPRERHVIEDFKAWWGDSCEADGALVNKIIRASTPGSTKDPSGYPPKNQIVRIIKQQMRKNQAAREAKTTDFAYNIRR